MDEEFKYYLIVYKNKWSYIGGTGCLKKCLTKKVLDNSVLIPISGKDLGKLQDKFGEPYFS